jgi:hypothetical protein
MVGLARSLLGPSRQEDYLFPKQSPEQPTTRRLQMPHHPEGTQGWTLLTNYQALWDPKINLGKFYFTTFQGKREETPYMNATNFAQVLDILRNEKPVYGNASTGSVTTQVEEVGQQEK